MRKKMKGRKEVEEKECANKIRNMMRYEEQAHSNATFT